MDALYVERMAGVVRYLREHAEQHLQGEWIRETECGTAGCLAGWTCLLNGYEAVYFGRTGKRYLTGVRQRGSSEGPQSVSHVAVELLGLDPFDEEGHVDYLFDANRTLDEIVEELDEITDGEVGRLLAVPA